jgi:hypothetical protein
LDLAIVVLMAVGVWAAAGAIFRSFVAREFLLWFGYATRVQRGRYSQAAWELGHGAHFDRAVARGDQMAAPRPLTDDELGMRVRRFAWLTVRSAWWRAIEFGLECISCHSFVTAIAAWLVFRGCVEPLDAAFTISLCGAVGPVMSRLIGGAKTKVADSCPTCQKN